MRILFGMVISLVILALVAILQPDTLAQGVYQLHDLAQTGKTETGVKWVKVELPK